MNYILLFRLSTSPVGNSKSVSEYLLTSCKGHPLPKLRKPKNDEQQFILLSRLEEVGVTFH